MTGKVEAHSPLRMVGPYRVERLIARGGMGAVYLARHINLHRVAAIKILSPSPDMEDSGSFEDRFRLEAETLAALNHPHIVTLYDYGETDDGRYWLALEYIDGPRYADLLRPGPMAPAVAVRYILQVCRALKYAHKRGVVHRDLKPSNLLTYRDDEGEQQVKVVDFGLVKVLEDDQSLTRAGLILGSPHCMAPEQIRGDDIDHRADIYAIGILLFRSLTGTWPFHGDSSTATMIAHINNPVPRMTRLDLPHEIPPLLEDAVRRCLSKRPDDRYPDVAALMTDLRRSVGVDPSLSLSSGYADSSYGFGGPGGLPAGTLADGQAQPTAEVPDPDPAVAEPAHPSLGRTAVSAPLPEQAPPPPQRSRALLLAGVLLLVLLSAGGGMVASRLFDGPAPSASTDGLTAGAPPATGAPEGAAVDDAPAAQPGAVEAPPADAPPPADGDNAAEPAGSPAADPPVAPAPQPAAEPATPAAPAPAPQAAPEAAPATPAPSPPQTAAKSDGSAAYKDEGFDEPEY